MDVDVRHAVLGMEVEHARPIRARARPLLHVARDEGDRRLVPHGHDVVPLVRALGARVTEVVDVFDVPDHGERGHLGHTGVSGPCEDPDQKKEKNPSGCRPVAEHWLRFASEVADGNRPFGRRLSDLEPIGSRPCRWPTEQFEPFRPRNASGARTQGACVAGG